MREKNLEERVNRAKASLSVLGAALASLYLSCAPSLKVPVTVAKESSVSCCDLLACGSRNYDYCQDTGMVYENGQMQASCKCKDYDRPGPGDRDRDIDRGTDRGGSWKCPR